MENENSVHRILHATRYCNTQAAKQLLSVKRSGFRFCKLNCYVIYSQLWPVFEYLITIMKYRIIKSIVLVMSRYTTFFLTAELGNLPILIFIYAKSLSIFITLIPFQLLKQQLQNNVRMCEGFYTTRPTKFFILFYKFDWVQWSCMGLQGQTSLPHFISFTIYPPSHLIPSFFFASYFLI